MKNLPLTEKLYFVTSLSEFSEEMEVEILTTAKQTDSRYGDFQFSRKDLEEMAKNFNENVVGTPIAVDLNHDPEHIALAWIKEGSMKVSESLKVKEAHSLFATIHQFTPKGEELTKTGAVRLFSVEVQRKFEKFVGGIKSAFSNVIRGLALTNRPVIKDMAPTFSEKNLSNNSKTMNLEAFKLASDSILSKENISDADVKNLKALSELLSEEDRETVKEDLEQAEQKANDAQEAEEAEKQEEAEKTAEAEAEKVLSENKKDSFTMSEVQEIVKQALKEPMQKITEVYASTREKALTGQVESLMLSETNKTGIKADAKNKVVAFVKKLSDDLAKEYFAIHKDILTTADFSEYGHGKTVQPNVKGPMEATAKLSEIAEKIAKEDKISLSDAYNLAMEKNPKLTEEAQKTVSY